MGRDLGEVEDDGGPELDVRREDAVRAAGVEFGEGGLLQGFGDLEAGAPSSRAVRRRTRARGSSAR